MKIDGHNGSGPLRQILEIARVDSGYSFGELTVLKTENDPYRHDTPAGHRDGQWFGEQVERFLPFGQTIHLRGLHYRLSSAGDVVRPDRAELYINNDENWQWLSNSAAKAARWLGYVPFECIVDERNAPPEIHAFAVTSRPYIDLYSGSSINLPLLPDEDSILPHFLCRDFTVSQPYRIVLFGEKFRCNRFWCPWPESTAQTCSYPLGKPPTAW
jgi:hypothetical protein